MFELDKEAEKPALDDKEHLYREEFDVENGKALLTVDQCKEGGDDFFMAVCNIASGTSYYLITISYTRQDEFDDIRKLLFQITT
jgi:hypothetical protein